MSSGNYITVITPSFSLSLFLSFSLSVAAMKKLLNIYHTAIKPMEDAFKYNELRQHEVTGKSASCWRLNLEPTECSDALIVVCLFRLQLLFRSDTLP